ncbi:MAG: terminase small subunit [Fibromonadaceae bacterium]|jgi:phage terminase small subunit|nr:terminase small subunit [Fibromonadaceae bacterium]
MRKISEQEIKFAENFIKTGGNIAQAAILAGYSKKNASSSGNRVSRYPRVQAKIKELQTQIKENEGYSKPKMIRELEELIAKANSGAYPNYAAVLKAKEMLCKILGYFAPDTQVNNFVGSFVELKKEVQKGEDFEQ